VALAVAEIVTNSMKHGYRRKDGPIHLDLARDDLSLSLRIADNGTGLSDEMGAGESGGIGMRMIADLFRQVDATIERQSNAHGLCYLVTIPDRFLTPWSAE